MALVLLQGYILGAILLPRSDNGGNSPYIGRGHDGWLPSDGPSLSLVFPFICLSSCSEDLACSKLGGGCTSYKFKKNDLDAWV